jgi:rhodanese-related sulfurtransferase
LFKKLFSSILFFSSTLFATITNQYPSKEIIDSKTPIVDIRTPEEWVETGIAKGAITIMFFDNNGNYNIDVFLKELNQKVDTKKTFALICRTGRRTKIVSAFLSQKLNYDVINLQGGMVYLKSLNIPSLIVPYKK